MQEIPIFIKNEKNNVCFSFFEKKIFPNFSDLDSVENDFVLDSVEKDFVLSKLLGEKNDFSKLPLLTLENVKKLASLLQNKINQLAEKNEFLVIKNSKFNCTFYSLVELKKFPNIKLVYVWNFSAHLIEQSMHQWVAFNALKLRACCLRNYIIERSECLNAPITGEEIQKSCSFPSKFVQVDCDFEVFVLNSENSNNSLDSNLCLNVDTLKNYYKIETLVEKNQKLSVSGCERFLSNHFFSKNMDKFNDPIIHRVLKEFYITPVFDLNCRDLLTALSLSDCTFEKFLSNCLFTIFSHENSLRNYGYVLDLNLKLIYCSFNF